MMLRILTVDAERIEWSALACKPSSVSQWHYHVLSRWGKPWRKNAGRVRAIYLVIRWHSLQFTTMFALARSVARPALARGFAASAAAATHSLPPLPYAYDVSHGSQVLQGFKWLNPSQALEPHISEEIMKLHHQKHHQTYVNGLNAAEDSFAKAQSTKEKISLQAALKFNGGGIFSPIHKP
jgi:hypothetical protein